MNLRNRFSIDGHDLLASPLRGASSSAGNVGFDEGNARASRVNRTHRVVQERAKAIAARRSKIRSLWLPLAIFSTLLVALCIAVWAVIQEYELGSSGSIQVSSYQILVPLFWSVPVSAALLAVVWFRQTRGDQMRSDTGRGSAE